ncbi:hypothetical protein [Psychromonas hadalis]|uniref:TackOD1 domain-containing metal-binding protein n=1 Tax=Psychromonas hadalis TaxID=211669 RepID=UPI0003B5B16F|nr:hypothetical protein [Psychromonas hadalis]
MDIYGYQLKDSNQQLKNIISFTSITELKEMVNIVVIIGSGETEQDSFLMQLHRLPHSWSWKIYTQQASLFTPHLSDGLISNTDLDKAIETHQQQFTLMGKKPKDKLLAWLWMDSHRQLVPYKSLFSAQIYSYPLLESYIDPHSNQYSYLTDFLKKGYLVKTQFVDRVRSCSHCDSNHLNYVEACPACHSNHIHSKNSLHCFTCGFVDHEDRFKKDNRLSCPKCLTQLKHIGVDYDRPLEVHECLDCNHDFIEADTVVNCFNCAKTHQIDNLVIEHVSVFNLTENVTNYLLSNTFNDAPSLLLKESIEPSYFISLLSWTNRLALNSGNSALLLNLSLAGRQTYIKLHGEVALSKLIEELKSRMYQIFKDTDVSCLYQKNKLLLLLPMTDAQSLNFYQVKLNEILALVSVDILSLELDAWQLPITDMENNGAAINMEAWLSKALKNV